VARVPKSRPFSIRLSQPTDRFVTAEAERTRRSKGAIVEALTEEAARMRRFPGIGFRGEDPAREAWVIGTGLDVWEIVELLRDYGTLERLVAEVELDRRSVELAQAYYASYPPEIDRALAENRRTVAELSDLYPFIEVTRASSGT
jgi:hypothetical protein